MNIFLAYIPEYKHELSRWLVEEKQADHVYIPYLPGVCKEKTAEELAEHVEYLPIGDMLGDNVADTIDLQDFPAPSKEFLTAVLPYEAMGIQLCAMTTCYPMGVFDEAKRRFRFYLRYWNHILQEKKIRLIVFDVIPHWAIFYSAYVAARILGIRTLMMDGLGIKVPEINGRVYVYGETMESLGENVAEAYAAAKELPEEEIVLTGLPKAYYERTLTHKTEASASKKYKKKWEKLVYKGKYRKLGVKNVFLWTVFHNVYYLSSALLKYRDPERYRANKYTPQQVADLKRLRTYIRYNATALRQYDKMATYPVEGEKYIYFPVQLWPEASTTPQGGVFEDQVTSIQLLSRCIRNYDLKIYVKEYYIQPHRGKSFWLDIGRLKNVRLIRSDVSSDALLNNAVAVASQTGTCLVEGPLYGIPSLAFGGLQDTRGMPGLFEITDEEQGEKVIGEILKGIRIDPADMKRYFYALQENTIFYQRDANCYVDIDSPEAAQTLRDMKKVIGEFVDRCEKEKDKT